MKITWKNYLTFTILILMFSASCLLFIHMIFYNTSFAGNEVFSSRNYGFSYATAIIKNNLYNFFQYLIFFIIAPVLIVFDISITMFQIYVSLHSRGGIETSQLLYRHGLIELPNVILYMLLSFRSFIIFWQNKDFKLVIKFWRANILFYVINILLIFLAGLIEGIVK